MCIKHLTNLSETLLDRIIKILYMLACSFTSYRLLNLLKFMSACQLFEIDRSTDENAVKQRVNF